MKDNLTKVFYIFKKYKFVMLHHVHNIIIIKL